MIGITIDYAGTPRIPGICAADPRPHRNTDVLHPRLTRVSIPSSRGRPAGARPIAQPAAAPVIITSGLIVAAYELFGFYMPVFGHSAGFSASTIGLIMGTYATATFLTRFFLPVLLRTQSPQQVLSFFMLLAAAGFLLMPLLRDAWLVMLVSFAIGIGMGVGQPISMTMAFNRSPTGRTGEVTGLRLTANNVARIVIPLTAGALGATFGVFPVFWMNA